MDRAKPLLVEQLERQLGLEVFRRDLTLQESEEKARWIEAFSKFLPPTEPLVKETLGAWVAYKQKVITKAELKRRFRAYPQIIPVHGIYQFSPKEDYELWSRIVGRGFLRELTDGLKVYYNYSRTPVDADGLYNVLLDLYYRTELPLNRSDVKILEVLSGDPLMSGRSVARKARLAHATVQSRLKRLRSRFDLRTTFQINYSKLGLERVIVVIPRSSLALRSYYTLGSYMVLCGVPWSHNVLAIPAGKTLSHLVKFLEQQVREGIITSFQVFRNPDIEFLWNFKRYNVLNHKWDMDWQDWTSQLQELISNQNRGTSSDEKYTESEPLITLDEINYQVLWELVMGYQPPLTGMARRLKIHPAKIRRLISTFQNKKVVKPYMYMVRVGLHRHSLAIFQADDRFIEDFRLWCTQFPSSEFYHLEDLQTHKKGILALIGLPKDGIYHMNKVLYHADAMDVVKLFVREVEIGVGRLLPPLKTKNMVLYDIEKGKWLAGEQSSFQLVSQNKK